MGSRERERKKEKNRLMGSVLQFSWIYQLFSLFSQCLFHFLPLFLFRPPFLPLPLPLPPSSTVSLPFVRYLSKCLSLDPLSFFPLCLTPPPSSLVVSPQHLTLSLSHLQSLAPSLSPAPSSGLSAAYVPANHKKGELRILNIIKMWPRST